MAWINRLFRKRDIVVMIVGLAIIQLLACLLINRFMFCPVRGGYDKTIDGFVDIGTNGVAVAARVIGPQKGKKAVVYCHGNAEDLTALEGRFKNLVENGYTVATFDYPGYGLSCGTPNEQGCYRNAFRLYDWLIDIRGFKAEDIIVTGYSIGTGVAVELAAKRAVGGLWLEAAYLSAPRVITKFRVLFVDPFPSIEKIGKVKCPVMMLHGIADSIIPYTHGLKLYEAAPYPKWFIPIQDADHDNFIDIMGVKKYNDVLHRFVRDGCLAEATHYEKR